MAEYYNPNNPQEKNPQYDTVWKDPNYQHSYQSPEEIASYGDNPSYTLIPAEGYSEVDPNDVNSYRYQYGPAATATTAATDTGPAPGTYPDNANPETIAQNPNSVLTDGMKLANQVPTIDPNTAGTEVNPNANKYQMDTDALEQDTATAGQVDPRDAQTYEAQTTYDDVVDNEMEAAQGELSEGAQVDPEAGTIDVDATARGETEVGKALQEYAEQNLDEVDDRATLKGQLDRLQEEFTGPNGEPAIPFWAQGTARAVSKIAAFKGMTGSAATAAMSQALLESSIQVAEKDAAFYQTLTLTNLNNKQQATINRAGVLANMELQNADARLAAAIQNSQAFLAMDLKNLDNEQQARVINNQSRIQSILEDAKAVNAQRLFTAESQNNMDMFYDNLNSSIEQFNASSINSMSQFNASMENDREKFYKEMQFQIDTANAKWRQTVTLSNAEMQFQAAATDVQNMVGLTTEALNQIWDRADALLDYAWKSGESELDRLAQLAITELQGEYTLAGKEMDADAAEQAGWGSLFGSVLGGLAGNSTFISKLFG